MPPSGVEAKGGGGGGVSSPQGQASVPPWPSLERHLPVALATPGNHGVCVHLSVSQPHAASASLGSLTPQHPQDLSSSPGQRGHSIRLGKGEELRAGREGGASGGEEGGREM